MTRFLLPLILAAPLFAGETVYPGANVRWTVVTVQDRAVELKFDGVVTGSFTETALKEMGYRLTPGGAMDRSGEAFRFDDPGQLAALEARLLSVPGSSKPVRGLKRASERLARGNRAAQLTRTFDGTSIGGAVVAVRARDGLDGGFPEFEMSNPPSGAKEVLTTPEGLTYLGYRWLRADGTTYDIFPSHRVHFQEEVSAELVVDGAKPLKDRLSAELTSRQYKIRLDFYKGVREIEDPDTGKLTREIFYRYHKRTSFTGANTVRPVELIFEGDRTLLPWESERFRVEFDGRSTSVVPVRSVYDYRQEMRAVRDGRDERDRYVLSPKARRLTDPDPEGISARLSLDGSSGRLTASFKDKWARYYDGQKFEVRLRLMRKRRRWADAEAAAIRLELGTKPRQALNLGDPALAGQWKERLVPGKDYYMIWEFRRLGRTVSTDKWMRRGRTESIRK